MAMVVDCRIAEIDRGAMVKIGPNLTLKDLESFRSTPQNRRSLLSVCNGIFDLLVLSSPYTIKLKILMKETLTVDSPTDWDQPVSSNLMQNWTDAMEEAISQEDLQFVRSCKPPNAVKRPRIIGFWDGSLSAFAGVLYVVTMVSKDDKVEYDILPE